MDAVQKLIEIEAIKQLKARYFRLLDTKQWEEWKGVWADEIEHEMITEQRQFSGPSTDFVGFVSQTLNSVVTVHHGHMPEIEILSPTEATGIWAFVDRLSPANDAREGATVMTGYGHYHERYVKVNGAWKIAAQKVTRLRMDMGQSG